MSARPDPPTPGSNDSPSGSPAQKRAKKGPGAAPSSSRGDRGAGSAASGAVSRVRPPPSKISRRSPAEASEAGSRLGDYITVNITVNVQELAFPVHQVRPLRDEVSAVEQFLVPFKAGQYGEGDNYISVALSPDSLVPAKEFVDDLQKGARWQMVPTPALPSVSLMVVDGAHRVHALRHPSLKDMDFLRNVKAVLYARKDSTKMTLMDFVTIGNRLNDIGSLQNKTTHYERVCSCKSLLSAVKEMDVAEVDSMPNNNDKADVVRLRQSVTSASLQKMVSHKHLFMSSVSGDMLEKICTIAVGVYKLESQEKKDREAVMQNVKKVMSTSYGLGLVSLHDLWEIDDPILLAMIMKCYNIHARKKSEKKKFPPMRFVQRISDLCVLIEREFLKRGIVDNREGWELPTLCLGKKIEYESLQDGCVTAVQDSLTCTVLASNSLWGTAESDVMKRLLPRVQWPQLTQAPPPPQGGDAMEIDSPPSAPRHQPSRSGSRSSGSDGDSESGSDRSGDSETSKESDSDKESPIHRPGEARDVAETSATETDKRRSKGKAKSKGRQSRRVAVSTESESGEITPAPPPRRRGGRAASGSRTAPQIADKRSSPLVTGAGPSQSRDLPEITPARGSARGEGRAWRAGRSASPLQAGAQEAPSPTEQTASPGRPRRGGKQPVQLPPRVTRKSARLKRLQGTGGVSGVRSEAAAEESVRSSSASEREEQSKKDKLKAEKRLSRVQSLSLLCKVRQGKFRHIRVPTKKALGEDSGDSSDCDTDLEKMEPGPWMKDENYIPRERRAFDATGFSVRHNWGSGLFYNRPSPRLGVFKSPVLKDPLNKTEAANPLLKRSGANKEWWLAKLPDGTKDWLYPDHYSRLVTNLPAPWDLTILPHDLAPEWTLKYKFPTSPPSDDELQYNREALLRSLGFRPPHQSHFRLTTEDILRVRWSVYRHMTREVGLPEESTVSWSTISEWTFKCLRKDLDDNGFLVVKDFVLRESTDRMGPNKTPWSEKSCKEIEQLFEFYTKRVPNPDQAVDGDVEHQWTKIRNKKTAPNPGDSRNARWQTTPWATNGMVETSENQHILHARCLIEVANWTLIHLLHCGAPKYGQVDFHRREMDPKLSATDSGSRVLNTSTRCDRQRPHKDYRYFVDKRLQKYGDLFKVPGLFSIVMGPEGGELWIVRGEC